MAFNGTKLTINFDGTLLADLQEKGFDISEEFIDVTTDDSNGFRTLLPKGGKKMIEVSVAGVITDEVLINEIMLSNRTAFRTTEVFLPTGTASGAVTAGSLSVDGALQNVNVSGATDGEAKITGTLVSSGAITYTATA
jgi:predicted secreted protein